MRSFFANNENRLSALLGAIATALLVLGSHNLGIWEPWEVDLIDLAKGVGEVRPSAASDASIASVSASISALGFSDFAARLPFLLFGVATLAAIFGMMSELKDRRTAIYATIICATSVLMIFNSRHLLGLSPAFFGQVLIVWGGLREFTHRDNESGTRMAMSSLMLLIGLFVSASTAGMLQGALPPLFAVASASWLAGSERRLLRLGISLLVLTLLAATTDAIFLDADGYSFWVGGVPKIASGPSYDIGLQRIFHGFAPWSGLAICALGMFIHKSGQDDSDSDAAEAHQDFLLMLALPIWAILGYASLTLFSARYGQSTYLPVAALAMMVAVLLREREKSTLPAWTLAGVAFLLSSLMLRDYLIDPASPMAALALEDFTLPEDIQPKKSWLSLYGLLLITIGLGLGPARNDDARFSLKETIADLKTWFRNPSPFRRWLWIATVALSLAFIVAIVFLIAKLSNASFLSKINSLLPRTLIGIGMVGPGILVAIIVGRFVFTMAQRYHSYRVHLILVAGIAFGLFTSLSFQKKLSRSLSPKHIFQTYQDLSSDEASLGGYQIRGRAAKYYAAGEVRELKSPSDTIKHLAPSPQEAWALLPGSELATLNRQYRKTHGEHIFIVDNSSSRTILASNKAIKGRKNANPLIDAVLKEAPTPQHAVGAMFEDKIELVGYDLELPRKGSVGPGQKFAITWYWKCLRKPGSYKIFLHGDGRGNRLNGDHDAVDGLYPVNLWEPGDVIVDRQELRVPANFRTGRYQLLIGFYSGNARLKPQGKYKSADNRAHAGDLIVR